MLSFHSQHRRYLSIAKSKRLPPEDWSFSQREVDFAELRLPAQQMLAHPETHRLRHHI